MKLLLIALLLPAHAFAYGYDTDLSPWERMQIEKSITEERNFNQNMMRELREKGSIAPKDYTDSYNYRKGYGHDGAHIDNHKSYRYKYGY